MPSRSACISLFWEWLTVTSPCWGKGAVSFTSDIWEHSSQYYRNCSFDGGRKECLPGRCGLSVCLYVCWSFGLPFYGVLVRPTQIRFHSAWQSQVLLLTAGFIWCGRPVLGFSAGFNIWSQLWPEEERMLADDWWLWADRRREVGRVEEEVEVSQQMETVWREG